MQIQVRALPAPGHDYRRRAGRTWGKTPTIVRVVDSPASPDEITPTQYAQLREDPMINAVPVGEATAEDLEVAALKAQFVKANATTTELRKQLADMVEAQEAQRTEASKLMATTGARVIELEREVEHLRGELAKKTRKA